MTAATISAYKNGVYHHVGEAFEAKDGGKPRFKAGYITTANTADTADTVTIDFYKEFGITRLMAVVGFVHTTENSVIVVEAPTTSVVGTEVAIVVGGSTVSNKKRCYILYGL